MLKRAAANLTKRLAKEFKIVAIVGPRQSGKTTLARKVFPKLPYVSLEAPDNLEFAREDPRRFLEMYAKGAVIDEVQRCPSLFSYLQGVVDQTRKPGRFILTGSQHFGLLEGITQSLAGRVGFVRLLPFSLAELKANDRAPDSLDAYLLKGSYPPLYDQPLDPERWLDAYITTYVERDVRQLLNVRDLALFQRFVRLCAGNIGQLLNRSRLGADLGVDQKTVESWLGILETSFILFRLQPHHRNFRKRLVKSPKLYFHDVGLAARLIGIEAAKDIFTHPLRGALFENMVVSELIKGRSERGKSENLYFWRSHVGKEIDVVADRGGRLRPIEIKAGATIASDWVSELKHWTDLAGKAAVQPTLIYGGEQSQKRSGVELIPWREIDRLARTI